MNEKEKERRATFQLSSAVSLTKSSNRNEMRVWVSVDLGRACRGIDAISLLQMQHNTTNHHHHATEKG